ncbi:ABC transporter permease [Rugamonas rivuli]|uniref:FtsX-like permease family protein n=1 Tax=Rugamonas rivuli TaxID=2743358 RepID=A0A843SGL2_9BURK|nr:ABC transporter permease [Rugamonas rivuli]MQA23765.1 FtsX-like permease family protein [Rugamonas rivuli]
MLRHLLKLIWKRKSRNMMLSLEILLAFVVVFAISAFALRSWQLYQMPTGFGYQDVWSVGINARTEGGIEADPQIYDKLRQSLKALPEVEEVSFTSFPVYQMSNWTSEFTLREGKRKFVSNLFEMSDEFPAVAGMTLAEGRWFSRADDGGAEHPVIINRRLAQKLFDGKPALGQVFSENEDHPKKALRQFKVVGIVEEFRSQGEFMSPTGFMLVRHTSGADEGSLEAIHLRVRPGTPRTFEAALNRQLKLVRNDWSYTISPLADMRTSMLKAQTIPLTILAVIAAFLLVMVAFGLFGVLWQNTTQRIPEIGLRRAIGADSGHIYSQIIVEQMLLSSGAIVIALLLLVQLPLTGALGDSLNWAVFLMATALSAGVIYLLSLLCSLYPGWRAARLSPTQALHYE